MPTASSQQADQPHSRPDTLNLTDCGATHTHSGQRTTTNKHQNTPKQHDTQHVRARSSTRAHLFIAATREYALTGNARRHSACVCLCYSLALNSGVQRCDVVRRECYVMLDGGGVNGSDGSTLAAQHRGCRRARRVSTRALEIKRRRRLVAGGGRSQGKHTKAECGPTTRD